MYPINFKGENNFLYLEFFKNQYGDPYFLFDKSMRCIIDIVHTKLEQILTSQNFSHYFRFPDVHSKSQNIPIFAFL